MSKPKVAGTQTPGWGAVGALPAKTYAAFTRAFGVEPAGVWSAPGRVNLIGEHTDYTGGASLPIAIDRRTHVAATQRKDRVMRIGTGLSGERIETTLDDLAAASGWSAYALGVLWAILDTYPGAPATGLDLWIESDVPVGVGVSSSASLEAAVCVAIDALWGLGLAREEMVLLCQRAENVIAGAPTGILDQSASLLARAGSAVLLDFAGNTAESVPLGFTEASLELLVIDSTIRHDHRTGGYRQRRRECDEAAVIAGVEHLALVPIERLKHLECAMSEGKFRRMRHVVTDTARCHQIAAILRSGLPHDIGPILTAAHASYRDDFAASVPAVDCAVDAAVAAGALGARLTGGGFGGACIALVESDASNAIAAAVTYAVVAAGHPTPAIFPAQASAGAKRDATP